MHSERVVELSDSNIIFGRNTVREALRARRPLNKIVLARGITPQVKRELVFLAREQGVPVMEVDRVRVDALAPGAAHQGIVAIAGEQAYVEVEDLLRADGIPLILVLNEIQDPHNLGAILRTAEAAGCTGAIIPNRRAVGVTPVVAKASAGAVNYIPVARVANIPRTLRFLKEGGLWIAGADPEGETVYWEADLKGPLALVIGGEDTGLGRVVRKECDYLVRLPMVGRVGSLNASVAAALLIYEVLRQRRQDNP
ncbi:MAG: 23S rRNA (guanosine(2251)-2'-O)-methyltransferase RlmB [Eubacteriales bacterium]|nr:23S rRNA (guanosine(2251)-2'-O)-methyltransferase RlmB [Eubacteriales bacterium]MDZ7610173.1 23S rRNA (guanosine(2251)-2'-O)-methyltransferase RlmB [Eubacteriales bacterium]